MQNSVTKNNVLGFHENSSAIKQWTAYHVVLEWNKLRLKRTTRNQDFLQKISAICWL